MLWHVGDALALSLGEISVSAEKPPIPGGLLKFIVLNLPWGKKRTDAFGVRGKA